MELSKHKLSICRNVKVYSQLLQSTVGSLPCLSNFLLHRLPTLIYVDIVNDVTSPIAVYNPLCYGDILHAF